MELREHQTKAIDMIRQSFRAGNKRVLLAACCSFGKTHTAAYMLKSAQDSGKRAVFFCDRIKLIDQTIEALDQWGIDYGVQQADHWLANPAAPIQICSMQTIARRGYDKLDFSLCIVDECHSISKKITEMIQNWDGEKMYYVGLSATPYAKGMGLLWQDMVVPVAQHELLKQGYLAPVRYYGGRSIDVRGLRSKALKTGSSDYHPDDVARVTEEEQEGLTGDIIKNWLAHGENAQTIAFCPSIKHSKYLVEMFNKAGIPARHIDGYTKEMDRQTLFAGHEAGAFKILSCSKLLGVGYDSPQTRVLIDCSPTKSAIAYQQRAGRIQRIHDSKEYAIYLDHAGNTKRFGFAGLMEPSDLDMNEKKFSETNQVEKKEKEEAAINECPRCSQIMQGLRCACGYEITITEALESDSAMLTRLDKIKKPAPASKEEKTHWYQNLMEIGRQNGYKKGWAAHQYRRRYNVWPRGLDIKKPQQVDPKVESWVTSQRIGYLNSKKKENQQKTLNI